MTVSEITKKKKTKGNSSSQISWHAYFNFKVYTLTMAIVGFYPHELIWNSSVGSGNSIAKLRNIYRVPPYISTQNQTVLGLQ